MDLEQAGRALPPDVPDDFAEAWADVIISVHEQLEKEEADQPPPANVAVQDKTEADATPSKKEPCE